MSTSDVVCVREDNEKHEKHVNELQARCRILETIHASADPDVIGQAGGLCVSCGRNEALLPPSVVHTQKRSVERLTRSVVVHTQKRSVERLTRSVDCLLSCVYIMNA